MRGRIWSSDALESEFESELERRPWSSEEDEGDDSRPVRRSGILASFGKWM